MDLLCLLATATLTREWGGTQQVLEPLPNQLDIVHELLPELSAQVTLAQLIDPLDTQTLIQSVTATQNEQWQRVEDLENRDSDPEVPLFSPTVSLNGETIFGISGIAGSDQSNSVVLQESVEFIFNLSFTGEDQLQIGFESGNAGGFAFTDELTFEGRLSLPADTEDDRFELSELSYEFPVGDRASLYLSAAGDDLDDFNPIFGDDSQGAISEFGTENSIHSLVEDFGLQLNYDLTDELSLSLGYFSGDAGNPEPGAGLFNGNHSAFVQLGFEPDVREASPQENRFLLGLTYIYTHNDSSLETEIGSLRSQINLESPVVGNSYGLSTSFSPSSRLAIGGWIGFTNATVLGLGTTEVWNYALTLALPDLGGAGNLLGVIIGQEPRLTSTSGFLIDGRRSDPNTSLHIEMYYSDRLSDHFSITPGLIWITAPNHDSGNPDIVVFTVRTTFEF